MKLATTSITASSASIHPIHGFSSGCVLCGGYVHRPWHSATIRDGWEKLCNWCYLDFLIWKQHGGR